MSETKLESHGLEPVSSTPVAERCEACGSVFSCRARLDGCWCSEVKLTDDTLANLRERYGHCLCRSCLERFAESEKQKN